MNNKPVIRNFNYSEVKPAFSEVAIIMGYSPGTEPSFLPGPVEALLLEASEHSSAAACYVIFEIEDIKIPEGQIYYPGGNLTCGSKIAGQMLGSDSFVLFVATAGNSFDDWIKSKAAENDVFSEYLCSSIGSVIADKAADVIQEEIGHYAEISGKGITNRYSPGYCSWLVMEQKGIFDLLPADKIGVTLTQSFLMKPLKSISGIIGIGKDNVPGPYMCEMCDLSDCMVKRARGL
jgi:hypothetical protein